MYRTPIVTTEEIVDRMVSAFLSWRLPNDFSPDAGISFSPPCIGFEDRWPVGTNLLNAEQAREMVMHLLKACSMGDN